jgi:hypothetical protein
MGSNIDGATVDLMMRHIAATEATAGLKPPDVLVLDTGWDERKPVFVPTVL